MMTTVHILQLLLAVSLGVFAQLLLKAGAPILKSAGPLQLLISKYFLGAIAFQWISAFIWVYCIRSIDLARAYPFTVLSFIMVPLLSCLLFGEKLDLRYILGIAFIFGGIILTMR